jgi:hypothetical protein
MIKEKIIKHYLFLNHSSKTEIRLFGSGINGKQLSYTVDNQEDFVNIIMDKGDFNVGVGINERANGGIEDKDVTDMSLIAIDIDTKDPEIIKNCEKKLIENGLVWAAKVFTGQKGYHYYFKVKKISNITIIKKVLSNARTYFIHDIDIPVDSKCFNPSRIFRVWGTYNKGELVDLMEFNPDLPEINAEEFFPEAEDDTDLSLVSKDKHLINHVIENFPLFDALYKNPELLPLKENTEFNDILLKNIAAYIQKKGTKNLNPWFKLIERKGHQRSQLNTWLKKPRFFNPFEVISNIRKNYYDELYTTYCKPLQQIPSHQIMYIEDEKDDWKEIKRKYRETDSFMVNRQFKTEGMLTLTDDNKVSIPLSKVYQGITDPSNNYKIYLDELNFKKGLSRAKADEMDVRYIGTISSTFYYYQLKSNNNIIIRVFSEEKIEDGHYELQGTLLEFEDKINIGNYSSALSTSFVMFLHSYHNKELKYFSLVELYKDLNITGDDMYRYVMTEVEQAKNPTYYKTSKFYEDLYMSFLLSSTSDRGEKLNMVIFGKSGTGKTPQLKAISEKFGELQFYSGTSLTIPGLTISFYTDPPKKGALLLSRRLCSIDEFFKIFNRLENPSEITKANDYFDNQPVSAYSGKSNSNVKSTCKMFGVTNPTFKNNRSLGIRKKMSLREMFQHYDPDFWGRFLIINQTEEDAKWIHNPDNKEIGLINLDINNEKFLAFYDFFNAIDLSNKIDNKRFDKFLNSIQVPEDLNEIYKKVCIKVPKVLFDGYVKWNIFKERRDLNILESDYDRFEILWIEIVTRWFDTEEEVDDLILNLSKEEKEIINKLKNEGNIHYKIMISMCKEKGIDYQTFKKRLLKYKIANYSGTARKFTYDNSFDSINEIEKDAPYQYDFLTKYK